ncbi:MAG: MBL fold metallo-hydrolase [Pseudomonadota bacterium]|nr:MBL fold metallo-hydrolase [Pseudomonadota bacterium]
MSQLRFASLGSGSRGNATLVATGETMVLVDCGFSVSQVEHRMAQLDASPDQLAGILVTHEHADHMGGVPRLARKYGLPVWMTTGTFRAARSPSLPSRHLINGHESFAVDGLHVQPYPVPHDAREPCQYVFSDGDCTLGILSDAGDITPHIRMCLDGLSALMLEFNHDLDMLAEGPYPPELRARVGGPLGHLNNLQAVDLLQSLDRTRLQHLVAGHISEKNNTKERVLAAVRAVLPDEAGGMEFATQGKGFDWRAVQGSN